MMKRCWAGWIALNLDSTAGFFASSAVSLRIFLVVDLIISSNVGLSWNSKIQMWLLKPLAVGSKFVTPVVIRLVNFSNKFAEGSAVNHVFRPGASRERKKGNG
jgi:hypothetical protein